jgi:hypothetical protein
MDAGHAEFIMENHDDGSLPKPPVSVSGSNSAHLMYVGMLLVVIIGLLAVLWSRERRLRVIAEQKVVNMQHLQQENQTLRKAIGAIGAFQAPATQPGKSN